MCQRSIWHSLVFNSSNQETSPGIRRYLPELKKIICQSDFITLVCIYVYYYALLIADRLIRHGWLATLCKQNASALYFPQMTCLATFSTTLTGSTLARWNAHWQTTLWFFHQTYTHTPHIHKHCTYVHKNGMFTLHSLPWHCKYDISESSFKQWI